MDIRKDPLRVYKTSEKQREKTREYSRKWRKENPEKSREYSRKWRKENPEKSRGYGRKWRNKNTKKRQGYSSKWREENPERFKENCRKGNVKRYGISIEIYEQRLHIQGNVCAICLLPCSKNKYLSIDHCHKTKRFRGLLCRECNLAIGLLKDDPSILYRALRYLLEN